MSYAPMYCQAEHPAYPDGCYESPNHGGRHRTVTDDFQDVYWGNGDTCISLTQAEAGILLTALLPIEQFFPELRQKLELMQANG